MQSNTFDPFAHTRLFFLFGLTLSLLFVLWLFRLDGLGYQGNLSMGDKDPIGHEGIFMATHSEPQIIEQPRPDKEIRRTARQSSTVVVVQNATTTNFTQPLKQQASMPVLKDPGVQTSFLGEQGINQPFDKENVDVQAGFPGGAAALMAYLKTNIDYTRYAIDGRFEGTVHVEFIIDDLGNVYNVKLLRRVGGGLDEEVLEAIRNMPEWEPAMKDGRYVHQRFVLPVDFSIR